MVQRFNSSVCVFGFFIEDLGSFCPSFVVFNGQIYFFDGANVAKYLAQFAGRDVALYYRRGPNG